MGHPLFSRVCQSSWEMESHVFCLFNKRYGLGIRLLENPLVDCLEENCSALPESSLSQMEGYSLLLNEIPSYFFHEMFGIVFIIQYFFPKA